MSHSTVTQLVNVIFIGTLFEYSVLLRSLPWLHYTTARPSCFGIPCTGHKWREGNGTRPHLSSQGL